MRAMRAGEVASMAGGELLDSAMADVMVGPDVVIDSRLASSGALFVAIGGERVDGHDYTAAVADQGAGAVLVQHRTKTPLPQIQVEDTVQGLSTLARRVIEQERARGLTTIAVTGSSGKTSVKDLLAQLLERAGRTVSPIGSFNNEIGVPLTACRVDAQTRFLVSEMGTRGIGQIRWLTDIVPPSIALVLNVGTAHIGEFGSAQNIAEAKGEIVESLSADGWAVLNAEDVLVAAMTERTDAGIAWFGDGAPEGAALVVRGEGITSNDLDQHSFTMVVEGRERTTRHPVQMQLLGAHQVPNALAAAAAAIVAGMDPDVVAEALSEARNRSPWRMELTVLPNGAAVINDAYNANPDSMRAAVNTLARVAKARRRHHPHSRSIAVLGDMLELGDGAAQLHEAVGSLVAESGIDELFVIGDHAADIARGAAPLGAKVQQVSRDGAAEAVALGPTDVVLVKASRGMALEIVADALVSAGGAGREDQ